MAWTELDNGVNVERLSETEKKAEIHGRLRDRRGRAGGRRREIAPRRRRRLPNKTAEAAKEEEHEH
ncbi:MAG: hypothetical protein ACLVB5_00745 [Christensenellales bacterium]